MNVRPPPPGRWRPVAGSQPNKAVLHRNKNDALKCPGANRPSPPAHRPSPQGRSGRQRRGRKATRLSPETSGIRRIGTHQNPFGEWTSSATTTISLLFAARSPFAARIGAANIGFIHFNATAEAVPSGTDHGLPQLMQPCPSRLITPEAKNALQTERTRPILLAGHKPHGGKSGSQRHSRAIENGSCRCRHLTCALPTMEISSTCCPWLSLRPAASALKSLRPNGNAQHNRGRPPHQQATPETLGRYADSPSLRRGTIEHL
jgi:hypothetical protein